MRPVQTTKGRVLARMEDACGVRDVDVARSEKNMYRNIGISERRSVMDTKGKMLSFTDHEQPPSLWI